jgi:hypothetical protein
LKRNRRLRIGPDDLQIGTAAESDEAVGGAVVEVAATGYRSDSGQLGHLGNGLRQIGAAEHKMGQPARKYGSSRTVARRLGGCGGGHQGCSYGPNGDGLRAPAPNLALPQRSREYCCVNGV